MGTMNGLENNKTTILAAGSKSSHLLSSLVSDLSFWELQPIQEEPHKLKTEVSYLSSSSEGSESDRNTTKTSSEETELPAPPPETVWKAAVDPVSGRTYYYDAITRKSQWEKVRTQSCGVGRVL